MNPISSSKLDVIDPTNEEEARLIHSLYGLYETHGALNMVTEDAERLGIRSRRRQNKLGEWRGGKVLSRGHIHYMLTSPIYAGRIPHKGKVFEGQHPAIIDPERWQKVQDLLKDKAPKPRERKSHKTKSSPLIGKLFDESGECLSPSHTSKRGRRYRYYISRGLVTGRKETQKGKGWRLPAEPLEQVIAHAVRNYLSGSSGSNLVPDACVATLQKLQAFRKIDDQAYLTLLHRVLIGGEVLILELDAIALAKTLDVPRGGINTDALRITVPFVQKRRGVETRFVMSGTSVTLDQTLIANIARAQVWLDRIKRGESFEEIAAGEGITKKRVQQILEFAFLAPDVVRDIIAGKQPVGLTSTWVTTHNIPVEWYEQRVLIATL